MNNMQRAGKALGSALQEGSVAELEEVLDKYKPSVDLLGQMLVTAVCKVTIEANVDDGHSSVAKLKLFHEAGVDLLYNHAAALRTMLFEYKPSLAEEEPEMYEQAFECLLYFMYNAQVTCKTLSAYGLSAEEYPLLKLWMPSDIDTVSRHALSKFFETLEPRVEASRRALMASCQLPSNVIQIVILLTYPREDQYQLRVNAMRPGDTLVAKTPVECANNADVWHGASASSKVTVSNSGHTIACDDQGWHSARATTWLSKGRWKYYIRVDAINDHGCMMIGTMMPQLAAPYENTAISGRHGWGYYTEDKTRMMKHGCSSNTTTTWGGPCLKDGDVITLKIDLEDRTMRMDVNETPFGSHWFIFEEKIAARPRTPPGRPKPSENIFSGELEKPDAETADQKVDEKDTEEPDPSKFHVALAITHFGFSRVTILEGPIPLFDGPTLAIPWPREEDEKAAPRRRRDSRTLQEELGPEGLGQG